MTAEQGSPTTDHRSPDPLVQAWRDWCDAKGYESETAIRDAFAAGWDAALAARPDVGSGPFDHEPPDLGTHCAGCAARPVSPPLDVAARAYREAHDLLAVTHTSAQRTVVIERLNDLAKAALAARDEHLAALTRRRP